MKKPSKTVADLEAMIRVEMETLCEWPTGMMVSVLPDGDSWRAWTIPKNSVDDAGCRDKIIEIANGLKAEYDLKV